MATEVAGPKNFIFFNLSRERIHEPSFLENPAIIGAQLKYTWRELEPERDQYAFDELLAEELGSNDSTARSKKSA